MIDLFSFADSRPPNYRPSDPITSRDAGRSAHSFTAEHHQAILNVLRRAGRPMAAEEVADLTSLDKVQICKRFAELERGEKIAKTAEQHVNRSGRRAFRYRIKAGE